MSSLLQKFQEVVELSVDISHQSYWCSNGSQIWLLQKYFFDLFTNGSQLFLGENLAVSEVLQSLVNVEISHYDYIKAGSPIGSTSDFLYEAPLTIQVYPCIPFEGFGVWGLGFGVWGL